MDRKEEPENEPMSSKYRRFLVTGLGRVFITRLISFFYIIYISRAIPFPVLDNMVFLAQGQYISIQVSLFGMSYALTKIKFDENLDDEDVHSVLFSTATIGIPLVVLFAIGLGFYADLTSIQMLIFVFSSLMQYILELGIMVNNIRLEVERGILALSLYSILNSLSVPLFFFYFQSLESVLLAWNFSFIFPIIYLRKSIIPTITNFVTVFSKFREIFTFGWPIYAANVFTFTIQRLDTFVLFTFFETGETSQYYLIFRIAQIGQELFMTLVSGLGPLLMAIQSRGSRSEFNQLTNSILRISLFVGIIYHSFLYFQSDTIILIILSDKYISGLVIMQIIFVAYFLDISSRVLNVVYGAEGHRRIIFKNKIFSNTIRLVLIVILARFGALGLALAFLITRFIGSSHYLVNKFSVLKKSDFIMIFLLMTISFGLTTLVNIGNSIVEVGIEIGIFVSVIMLAIYVLKPLTGDDFDLISRVVGNRFAPLKSFIRYIAVSSN